MSRRPLKAAVAGIASAGLVIAGAAFGATAANADPLYHNVAPFQFVAAGSDTIFAVYNSFSNGYNDSTGFHDGLILDGKPIAINSIDSTDPAYADPTKAPAGQLVTPSNAYASVANAFGRPNGSGDGRGVVSASWNPASNLWNQGTKSYAVTPHSVDIGRASGKAGSATTDATGAVLTYVPLGRDALAIVTDGVTLPGGATTFTTLELQAIFGAPDTPSTNPHSADGVYAQNSSFDYGQLAGANQADPTLWANLTVGDIVRDQSSTTAAPEIVTAVTPTVTLEQLKPLLPQSASGTRQFFLTAIGYTVNNDNTKQATWIPAAEAIEENTGSNIVSAGPGAIAPFSAAGWIGQSNGVVGSTGITPALSINGIDGLAATTGTAPTLSQGPLFGDAAAPPTGGVGHFNRDTYSVVANEELNSNPTFKTVVETTLPGSPNISAYGFEKLQYTGTEGYYYEKAFLNGSTTPNNTATTTALAAAVDATGKVTLTATVSPTGVTTNGTGDGAKPIVAGTVKTVSAGTVTFLDGTTPVGSAPVNSAGVATAAITPADGKAHSYTASFSAPSTGVPQVYAASMSGSPIVVVAGQPSAAGSAAVGSVSISGTAKVGSTLTAHAAGATSGATVLYQWFKGSSKLGSPTTTATLVVPASAKGAALKVTATAFKTGLVTGASKTSAATKNVAAGTLKTATPKITGAAKVGSTLKASAGTWTSGTRFAYVWKAGHKVVGKSATLKVPSSAKGQKITVTVTGSLSGYATAAKTSKASATVK